MSNKNRKLNRSERNLLVNIQANQRVGYSPDAYEMNALAQLIKRGLVKELDDRQEGGYVATKRGSIESTKAG